jgi:hypothetical protein
MRRFKARPVNMAGTLAVALGEAAKHGLVVAKFTNLLPCLYGRYAFSPNAGR